MRLSHPLPKWPEAFPVALRFNNALPPPPPDRAVPNFSFGGTDTSISLKKAVAKGVGIHGTMNEPGSSSLALTISAAVAKKRRISGTKVNGRSRVGAVARGYSRAGKQKFVIKIYQLNTPSGYPKGQTQGGDTPRGRPW